MYESAAESIIPQAGYAKHGLQCGRSPPLSRRGRCFGRPCCDKPNLVEHIKGEFLLQSKIQSSLGGKSRDYLITAVPPRFGPFRLSLVGCGPVAREGERLRCCLRVIFHSDSRAPHQNIA